MNRKLLVSERIARISGGVTGVVSFLGGSQVCHNVCLALLAILPILGISVAGMPLLFLTSVAVPFWIAAVALFFVMVSLAKFRRCISTSSLLLNGGLIVAGVPFASNTPWQPVVWIAGALLVTGGIILFFSTRRKNKKN